MSGLLCDTVDKLPHKTHYVILRGIEFYIPADVPSVAYDERLCSPARNLQLLTYEAFEDREAWEAAVDGARKEKTPFKAMRVHVAEVTTKVEIKQAGMRGGE